MFKERFVSDSILQKFLKHRYEVNKKLVIKRRENSVVNETILVLSWNEQIDKSWSDFMFTNNIWVKDCDHKVEVTFDRNRLPEAHIILLGLKTDDQKIIRPRLKHWQKLAYLTLEPDLINTKVMGMLKDITILLSFSQFAEVEINYKYSLYSSTRNGDVDPVEYFTKTKPILGKLPDISKKRNDSIGTFFISGCDHFDSQIRLNYLEKLTKLVPLHSYGNCMHTPGLNGSVNKVSALQQYYFNLAFENSIMTDYVTEKFYQGITSNTIMIYLGAPNIQKFLPNPSKMYASSVFLNVFDYPSPEDLAKHMLELVENKTKYLEYFKWRLDPHPFAPSFGNHYNFGNHGKESFFCRMTNWYVDHLEKK